MANGDIVPAWDEWRNLTTEQKEYFLHRTLASLDKKIMKDECDTKDRIESCHRKFENLETKFRKKRVFDSTISFLGGIIGGIVAILSKKII